MDTKDMATLYKFIGLLMLGVVLSLPARAQSCGYVACEEKIASSAPGTMRRFCAGPGAGMIHVSGANPPTCTAQLAGQCGNSAPPGRVCLYNQQMSPPSCAIGVQAVYDPCNCASRPNWSDPSGPLAFANIGSTGDAKKCIAGCTYVPEGPYGIDKWQKKGGYAASAPGGWRPDGSQCNPVSSPGDDPGEPDNCKEYQSGGDAQICIKRPPDDPKPPEFCVEVGGKRICAKPDDGPCSGDGTKGYLCVGNPPPKPPPPPETKPDPGNPNEPAPPDASGGPTSSCNGAGACSTNNWNFHEGGGNNGGGNPPGGGGDPPDPPDPPEQGGGGSPNVCPDGSAPQAGKCPAPVTCPGGTAPVNGQCPSGPTGCPAGATYQNGQCSDGSDPGVTCPGGATPNANGTCPGIPGRCPNGSMPQNGQCDIASPCNPETDPNQCQGEEEGHASGGQTCAAAPACSGDPILCSVLDQQWRTRCAVESLSPRTSPTDAEYGPEVDASGVWGNDTGANDFAGIDSSGFLGGGGGGTCPALGTAEFMDVSINISDLLPCWALRILAGLILAGGFVQAGFIIGRG